jgi:SpoVK/Ycf46/Vps4 family AAA+-type ATPase
MHTLDVFLGYATFRERLGGNPRRGILFEGPPGTGKTYLAKAMAKQAGVPFLFAASPAFQSMWYGMSAVKIRSFFKALRKAARREGGAIGFIEEIDAIGGARGPLSMSPGPAPSTGGDPLGPRARSHAIASGNSGLLNELLIQLQSFDQPPLRERAWYRMMEWVNGYLPEGRRLRSGKPKYHNILLIAATNRAEDLDPALLRPGRFDRRLYFDLPTKQGRRDLIDYFLSRKSHHEQLDDDAVRDHLAHDTRHLHRCRAEVGGHPRGRPRDRGVLPRGGPASGDPFDHQATTVTRAARARRHRGAVHAVEVRARGGGGHRARRPGR